MGIFYFLRKRRDEIHAEAPTTTSLAYHVEHETEKPFVFQSPPKEPLKIYTVSTYEEHLESENLKTKTPFTKDDIQAKKGEFDNLISRLKDHQLEIDIARADFYSSSYSQEDVEYAENYDEMRYAEYCEKFTENEIEETQDQISHMNRTLDANHTKFYEAWNKSNEVHQSEHEPER